MSTTLTTTTPVRSKRAPNKRTAKAAPVETTPVPMPTVVETVPVAAIAAIAAPVDETDEHGVLVRRDDEPDMSYVVRLTARPTAANIAAATTILTGADRDAAVTGFETRINLSFMAGYLARGEAHLIREGRGMVPAAPSSFDDVSGALGITAKGGGRWMGRRYSTLRECYDIATVHSTARRDAYLAAFRLATVSDEFPEGEHAPEMLREYLTWARQDAKGSTVAAKNTIAALVSKRTTARNAAAKAETAKAAKAETLDAIVDAGLVDGCPLSAEQWADMSEQTLKNVAAYATALASELGATRREEERAVAKAEKAAKGAAETGPVPAAAPRVTVQA
jgi:hypothetical protein